MFLLLIYLIYFLLAIANGKKHEIKNFEIDLDKLNQFEIANKLWDLIEGETL